MYTYISATNANKNKHKLEAPWSKGLRAHHFPLVVECYIYPYPDFIFIFSVHCSFVSL